MEGIGSTQFARHAVNKDSFDAKRWVRQNSRSLWVSRGSWPSGHHDTHNARLISRAGWSAGLCWPSRIDGSKHRWHKNESKPRRWAVLAEDAKSSSLEASLQAVHVFSVWRPAYCLPRPPPPLLALWALSPSIYRSSQQHWQLLAVTVRNTLVSSGHIALYRNKIIIIIIMAILHRLGRLLAWEKQRNSQTINKQQKEKA